MKYTIIIFAENKPGVLYRIADLFLRRKINIDSLTVSETEQHGISRFTVVVSRELELIKKVVKQLYRIIEVVKVLEKREEELIFREIALIKVVVKNATERKKIEDITHLSNATVNAFGEDYVVIEKSGTEDEITRLYGMVKPFGIKEFVRSGRIAVLKEGLDRHSGKPKAHPES
ncbi:MAG: acetolactate synthase small subunit [Patescibacteria group bacterium]